MLTERQQKLVTMLTKYEELKIQMKLMKVEMNLLLEEESVGAKFQDPSTKLVYKIIEPEGTFIEFTKIGYLRTRKEGEKGGNYMAKKEAEELGFIFL